MEKIKKFNQQEAFFIAEIILNRLSIKPKKNKIGISHKKSVDNVLSTIERQEDSWQYKLKSTKQKYGQKLKNEIIRFWSVPKMTALVLESLIIRTNSKRILEIGTSVGYSTLHLASAAQKTKGKVVTIENFLPKIKLAQKNIDDSNLDNIEIIKIQAKKFLRDWKGPKFDFVFLDADKQNYGKYLKLMVPLMKKGGIIIVDNINDYGYMMEDYLYQVSGSHFPGSRSDKRLKSTYIAQLDNGILITKLV